MAHYLFNHREDHQAPGPAPREVAAGLLGVRMWGVGADESHRDALAPGDLALIYLAAPDRVFVGRAELASAVHDWSPSQARVYPGVSPGGVLLTRVEEWDPAVPMASVLAEIGPSETTKADFPAGVVRITDTEYAAALAVAARR
ncbi:MAG: hypothetical protein ABWZ91_12585 [Nocardioides sp.]